MKNKLLACFVVTLIILAGSYAYYNSSPIQEQRAVPKAKFALAVYPTGDSYGQGFDRVYALVNGYYNKTLYDFNGEYNRTIELAPEDNLTLTVYVWMNKTLTGVSSIDEILNVIKLHISIKAGNGTEVWSKQNFTYQSPIAEICGLNGCMVNVHYLVYLDFIMQTNDIYTGTITYEVYY